MDKELWKKWLAEVMTYAVQNPYQFIYYLLLCLSPLFLLSAVCAYYMMKEIEQKEKETKRKSKMKESIAKGESSEGTGVARGKRRAKLD